MSIAQTPLGQQLRELREAAKIPGRAVAAAAQIDSGLLCKIETCKRLPTVPQLAAMAKFFKVPVAPLEGLRIVEEFRRKHGSSPAFAYAATILREEEGEYGVKKMSATAGKSLKPVNKRGKTK